MSRLLLHQILLQNLAQTISPENHRIYMTREEAYQKLKGWTGQDFGLEDVQAWKTWVKQNLSALRERDRSRMEIIKTERKAHRRTWRKARQSNKPSRI